MSLPLFFHADINDNSFLLNEETSKHVSRVLRMKEGEQLQLTNGNGQLLSVEIVASDKRVVKVNVLEQKNFPAASGKVTIAISLVKNTNRFEWFLEKATEIGVKEIVPLICERTEKQHFRLDRMKNILVSAMIQSRQVWLPQLTEPVKFTSYITNADHTHKFIAHCSEGNKMQLSSVAISDSAVILIGPEGDFTDKEIAEALANRFSPVALGDTRLRTETAGVVAAVLLAHGRGASSDLNVFDNP